MSPKLSLAVVCSHTRILLLMDCIPRPVHFSPLIHLFSSCKFVLLSLSHLFLSSPLPSPSGSHLCVLCLYECVSDLTTVHLFCVLDSA